MKIIKRLKILPPTLREKKRFIKFQVLSEEKINYEDLEQAIWNTLLDFYGEEGVAKTGLWVMKNLWDSEKKICVIRCNNLSVQKVIAGLGLISRLGDTRIIIKILKVSGTLKGLKMNCGRK
jgi:ribonuclease P/MRP protein subunit POP5